MHRLAICLSVLVGLWGCGESGSSAGGSRDRGGGGEDGGGGVSGVGGSGHGASSTGGQSASGGVNGSGGSISSGGTGGMSGSGGSGGMEVGPAPNWVRVAAGNGHTCAIDDATNLYCWGRNLTGQLGVGDTIARARPTLLPGNGWTQLGLGYAHSCGVRADETMWCWGYATLGRLGAFTNSSAMRQVASGEKWAEVESGEAFSCARTTQGALYCWGHNDHGQAGGADFGGWDDAVYTPTQLGTDSDWTHIAAGSSHACGIRDGGRVFCWGRNNYNQLDNDTDQDSNTPVEIALGSVALDLDASGGSACAIVEGGTVACWGLSRADSLSSTETFEGITMGSANCLLTDTHQARCFGGGSMGQLLDGNTEETRVVPASGPDIVWGSLAAGGGHTCGVDTDGVLWCAGDNSDGQAGLGLPGDKPENHLPRVIADAVRPIGAGNNHSCAGISGLSCWGNGNSGRLGDGTGKSRASPSSVGGGVWKSVDGGAAMTCGVDGNDNWYCWGRNTAGLGVAGELEADSPLQVGAAGSWAKVDVGGSGIPTGVACALRNDDGSLWCFGYGTMTGGSSSETPVKVSGAHVFSDFGVGYDHACALDQAGVAWCWGDNGSGEFGNGNNVDSDLPVPGGADAIAEEGMHFVDISVGENFTCAVRNDGSLWCWGAASTGRLGDGSTSGSQNFPVQVGGSISWRRVFTGAGYACALDDAGASYCWGSNGNRETGTGSLAVAILTPTKTITDLLFVELALGNSTSCGITTNDELACWGSNVGGRLGDGLAFALEAVPVVAPFVTP